MNLRLKKVLMGIAAGLGLAMIIGLLGLRYAAPLGWTLALRTAITGDEQCMLSTRSNMHTIGIINGADAAKASVRLLETRKSEGTTTYGTCGMHELTVAEMERGLENNRAMYRALLWTSPMAFQPKRLQREMSAINSRRLLWEDDPVYIELTESRLAAQKQLEALPPSPEMGEQLREFARQYALKKAQ